MFLESRAPLPARQHAEKQSRPLPHHIEHAVELRRSELLPPRQSPDVPRQIGELETAHAHAEILPGHVLDLVRLVEDHRRVIGNDSGEVLVPGRKIGEKQMVVDDNDVALVRPLPHLGQEASLELRAALSGAKVPPRVQLRPRRAVLGQRDDLRPVPRLCRLLPLPDHLEIGDLLQAAQHRLPRGVVNLLAAGVIGAPLHVTDLQRLRYQLLQQRNVLEIQLLLQVLGAGGNHHAPPG